MTEAPTPTPNKKHFDISSDNKTFSIDMALNKENISFNVTSVNTLKNESFENSFSFSQIQANKYFKICESLNEAFLLLIELSNCEDKKIISKSSKEISLIFPINNPLIKEVSFLLKIKEKNLEDKIDELYNLIEKQQIEINSLKKEIADLKEQKKKRRRKKR